MNQDQKNKVLEQQRHVSETISDLCRYIAFGIAGTCYLLFTSDSEFSSEFVSQNRLTILASAIAAVLTIVFDYLQFLCGYISVRIALKNAAGGFLYKKNVIYHCRFWFFYFKQATTLVAALLLTFSLLKVL